MGGFLTEVIVTVKFEEAATIPFKSTITSELDETLQMEEIPERVQAPEVDRIMVEGKIILKNEVLISLFMRTNQIV